MPIIFPQYEWKVDTREKVIYLTFDDGPVPDVTEFVLEQLAAYNAKATFFCVGHNIEKHPDIFDKVLEGGHSFGNHTYNHLKGHKTDPDEYIANFHLCEEIIKASVSPEKLGGNKKPLFRPPYGRMQTKQQQHIGLTHRIIMWHVLSADFDPGLSAEKCFNKTADAAGPGSIVLFHDSIKAEKNMRYALPRFLDMFTEKGYRFEAL
ncbi:MAG: polysaccharide deacetylase family protein [Bacteroidota bacterium]